MTTVALRELATAMLPAALGSIAVVYSNIINIGLMSKIRYADKQPVHPYKPWDDKGDKADQHFRAFKACQNGTEWTVYMLPCVGLYGLYTPLIPKVGLYVSWFGLVLSIAFAYYNVVRAAHTHHSAAASLIRFAHHGLPLFF